MDSNFVIQGGALEVLKGFPDKSVDMVISSPPYWGLRQYAWINIDKSLKESCNHEKVNNVCVKCGAEYIEGMFGLESTIQEHVDNMMSVMTECKRVLADYGTLWLNYGDTYNSSPAGNKTIQYDGDGAYGRLLKRNSDGKENNAVQKSQIVTVQRKSMCMVPERLAIRMVDDGWVLRNKIIWHKPSVVPQCLHPNTKIFVNLDGYIEQITLGELSERDWGKCKILSPDGWVKINNLWKSKKKQISFDCAKIDSVICSEEHRFGMTRDRHKNRKLIMKYDNPVNMKKAHRLLYYDISEYFKKDEEKVIDIIDIELVDWKANFTDDSRSLMEILNISPLELARKSNDKSLKRYNKGWGSNTHNEYKRKRISIGKITSLGIPFDKVSAKNSSKAENRYYDLDYDLGYLIGIYAAEGGFNTPRGFQGKITMGIKELSILERIKSIIEDKIGSIPVIKKYDTYADLTVNSAVLNSLCKYIVLGKCINKSLNNNCLLNAPVDFRKGLWDGYIDGDGHITKDGRLSAGSASKQLIKDFQLIGVTLGHLCSIYYVNRYDERFKKNIESWVLTEIKTHNVLNDDYRFVRPININETDEFCEMIDIEVEGNHTFIIENGLVSHNSAKDRFTNDWEYIYFFSKKPKGYYFEQQFEECKTNGMKEWPKTGGNKYKDFPTNSGKIIKPKPMRNCRAVWKISTQPVKESHFASFPFKLIERPIIAGCPELVCTGKNSPAKVKVDMVKVRETEEYTGQAIKEYDEIKVQNPSDTKRRVLKSMSKQPVKTLIDGCGQPVISEIEIEQIKTGKGGYDKHSDRKFGFEHRGYMSLLKKSTTKATHCSCGSPFRRGIVLDPFMGSGTTAIVARALDRDWIGIELNPEYIAIMDKRMEEWPKEKVLAKLNGKKYKKSISKKLDW